MSLFLPSPSSQMNLHRRPCWLCPLTGSRSFHLFRLLQSQLRSRSTALVGGHRSSTSTLALLMCFLQLVMYTCGYFLHCLRLRWHSTVFRVKLRFLMPSAELGTVVPNCCLPPWVTLMHTPFFSVLWRQLSPQCHCMAFPSGHLFLVRANPFFRSPVCLKFLSNLSFVAGVCFCFIYSKPGPLSALHEHVWKPNTFFCVQQIPYLVHGHSFSSHLVTESSVFDKMRVLRVK